MTTLASSTNSLSNVAQSKRWVLLFSPILVVGLGYLIARFTGAIWGVWAWVPILVYYWGILIALIFWGGGLEAIRRWLQASRSGRWLWVWRGLSLFLPALFFPTVFLPSLPYLNKWWIVLLWVFLGMVNPWIEEGYWRGLLMDAASGWPGWLAGLYSAFWFGASHPLILGVNGGDAIKGIPGFIGTFIVGLVWALVYRQTRSLRWPVFGHFLQDMFAPPILVFLNLAIIPR